LPSECDLDFETASNASLPDVGLHNYATDKSTRVLLLSYSFDNLPEKIWRPHLEPFPEELMEVLEDPLVTKKAFNCNFERLIFLHVLGIDIPINEWRDVQVMARYYSLPGSLEDVCEILQLDQDSAKLDEGKALIRLFCEPFIDGADSPLFGQTEPFFKDWRTNPLEWARFEKYNRHDVKAEIAVAERLIDFPLPAHEWRLWELDQKINDRGLEINVELIEGAIKVVEIEQAILFKQLQEITKVDNPNSPAQLLAWAKTEGYPFAALGKTFVERAIQGEGNASEKCKQALILRKQASKSSVKKLYALRNTVCEDRRLRNQFVFGGAARTMRWSGRDFQIQNLSRPTKEVEKNMDRAIELLLAADHETIKKEFSSVLDVAGSCIRPTIIAPKGKKLVVADFSSVESRVIGWVSGCERINRVFAEGLDSYIDFATEMFNKPYEKITKEERNQAKAPTLGCGFGLGPGEEKVNVNGDIIYTGLMGYARAMGIEMSQEDSIRAVSVYRKKFPEVPRLWKNLDRAALSAVKDGVINQVDMISFDGTNPSVLRMILPSGRALHYAEPQIDEVSFTNREGETYTKECVSYMGMEQTTRQWKRLESRPGLWTENSVQSIARDLLGHALMEADANGETIVGHIHDEILTEADENDYKALDRLIQCMTKLPVWASGLLIKAEGFVSDYYRKG
jgi:DNA polymerase